MAGSQISNRPTNCSPSANWYQACLRPLRSISSFRVALHLRLLIVRTGWSTRHLTNLMVLVTLAPLGRHERPRVVLLRPSMTVHVVRVEPVLLQVGESHTLAWSRCW